MNDLVNHKRTVHGVLRYACDLCNHTDALLEGLWRHKIDAHQAYEPDGPDGTYHMQQMLLISLSAQVEFLVQSLASLNIETKRGFQECKTEMNKLEDSMEKVDCKVNDLGVALAKTSRFDTKIQNDSQAVLTKVSAKCAEIGNIVLNVGLEASKKQEASKKNEEPNKQNASKKADDVKEAAADKSKNKPVESGKHRVTWVGTSLSKPLDKKKFENDTNVDLTLAKAYCIKEEGRFKESNFTAIVPELVEMGAMDTLVLETGSIEITNIDMNKAIMDTGRDISDYKKEWYARVEDDSKNLFGIAEDAITKDPKLNVVIVKRLQRFDRSSVDMFRIKSQLSKFSNHVYDQLWLKQGSPERIHIVELDMDCEKYSHLKELIYGHPNNPKYDGIHMIGEGATRHFTYRAVQAFRSITSHNLQNGGHFQSSQGNFRAKIRPNYGSPTADRKHQDDLHINCEQALYQRQSSKRSHCVRKSKRTYADAARNKASQYNVPTRNFYTPLNC